MKKKLREYFANNIDEYEERLSIALSVMGRMRCPLSIADYYLYAEMESIVDDFCEQLGIENTFDIEEIIFDE